MTVGQLLAQDGFALVALVPVIVALVLVDGPSTIPPLGAAGGFAIK